MTPTQTSDRADATVWLPLLHILGGVAERVARQQSDEVLIDNEHGAGAQATRMGTAGDIAGASSVRARPARGGRP
ncbi:MAG: hypothetical protein M3Q71_09440 [Chloroflexota bacterium]|nr:hypothetical protein [Chloroflexota bacterium]